MNKRIVPAALVALGLVAASCGSDDSSGSDATTATTIGATDTTMEAVAPRDCTLDSPLKIGFAADLGEIGAASDQPGSEAAQVQVDIINAAGGVGNLPIEYQVKDVQGDPAATQRAAQELLDDGVNAIIGPPFANIGAPLLDTVAGKAPVVFMASTDISLADPSRGAFLTSFSDPVQAAAAAEYVLSKDLTTAVTFSSSDDVYFSGNPKFFTTAFTEGGGEVVQDFSFSLADSDFSTQVNELAALDPMPQVLFTAMIQPQIGTLLEQMKGAGLDGIQVIGVDGFDATGVWTTGDAANGVLFTAHTFPNDQNDVQAFLDAAKTAGAKIETISFGALASDAVQILAAAAEQACSVDAATLTETIANLKDLKVTTGSVTYAGTNGVPEKDVYILGVENGEPTFVEALRPKNIPS
jgi:branched-chain amino acid transport system substrate-binding protein